MDGKIDKQRRDRCSTWRRAMTMQRGAKVGEEEVRLATVVDISSAGCRGQMEVATLAHTRMCFVL